MLIVEKIKILRCIKQILKIVNEETYYPEHQRKRYLLRLFENFSWAIKYKSINKEYNFYGININKDGILSKYAYNKFRYGGPKVEIHPDSGVVFSGFKIPVYYEAIEQACNLHRHLYGLGTIG